MDAVAHTWRFDNGLTRSILLGRSLNQIESVGAFTLQRVLGNNASTVTSTLSVTAFAGLNGTQISCRDGIAAEQVAGKQQTTAMVFGETLVN